MTAVDACMGENDINQAYALIREWENPNRVTVIYDMLKKIGILEKMKLYHPPRKAELDDLLRVHSLSYIQEIQEACKKGARTEVGTDKRYAEHTMGEKQFSLPDGSIVQTGEVLRTYFMILMKSCLFRFMRKAIFQPIPVL